jgi:hypothetical protein
MIGRERAGAAGASDPDRRAMASQDLTHRAAPLGRCRLASPSPSLKLALPAAHVERPDTGRSHGLDHVFGHAPRASITFVLRSSHYSALISET